MNKVLKRMAIVTGSLFLAFAIFFLWLTYESEWKITELAAFQNEETGNVIVFQEIGSPIFFGPSHVKIKLLNAEGKTIYEVVSWIYHDGSTLEKDNMEVRWHSDYAEVILSGNEQEDERYEIKYD